MVSFKRHFDFHGAPLCPIQAEGALLVDDRYSVTCEDCKRRWCRLVADASFAPVFPETRTIH